MKKLVSLLLCLSMLLCGSALAEVNLASDLPIVTEPLAVTIDVVPQGAMVFNEFNEETFWMTRFLKAETGLDITWNVIDPASAGEQIPLKLASGDLGDAMTGRGFNTATVMQYGVDEEMLMDISDLIPQYAPYLSAIMEKQPEIAASITAPNGAIYGFPALGDGSNKYDLRFWIHQDWLDAVGMENPKTLDELYNVLVAFKEKDPNGNGEADEIPFGGSWKEGYSERGLIKTAFGYPGNSNLTLDYTGKTDEITYKYFPATEEYGDFLRYMNKLYKEGLLDPDIFTQDEVQSNTKVLENRVGLYGGATPEATYTANPSVITTLSALTSDANRQPTYPGNAPIYSLAQSVIFEGTDPEKAAALVKLFDYFYSPEWYNFNWYGPEEGSEYDYDQMYGNYYNPETAGYAFRKQGEMSRWTFKCTYVTFWEQNGYHTVGNDAYELAWAEKYPDSVVGKMLADKGSLNDNYEILLNEAVVPYYVDTNPVMYMSVDDQERLSELQVPLDDYVAGMEAKFITGELDIEAELANFQKTLSDYKVEEYLEIQNKYYDIYKANLK